MLRRFLLLAGAERDADTEAEAAQYGDMLFTDDRMSGYRSIVHKTYFVLEHVVSWLKEKRCEAERPNV